jgi:cytochrome c-type biogenesis protein
MALDSSGLGPIAAFAAGVVSFLSPCVLPLVPGYVSFIAGTAAREQGAAVSTRWTPPLLALAFVLGFSTVFTALGATASAVGSLLLQYRREASVLGGGMIVLFGLLMLWIPAGFGWLQRDVRWHPAWPGGRPVLAFGLGLAFGFGWTPCIGPVLGAILTLAAVSGGFDGVGLLAIYSTGLGIPFVLAAAFTGQMLRHQQTLRRMSRPLQVIGGIVLVAMGAAMISGHLTDLSFWLLRMFPSLGRIG